MTETATVGCLPEVERLLLDVLADGFTVYCCGPKTAPTALVAAYGWPDCIDLITIRDFDRITAARTPKRDGVDVFAPEIVVWAYEGPPQWTLRALLSLVHPQHPDAPHGEYPAPQSLRIRRAEQRPHDDPAALSRPCRGACQTARAPLRNDTMSEARQGLLHDL